MKINEKELADRLQAVELMLSDVDGVLTDGRLIYDNQGIETKQFHVRDGMGVKLWQKAGHRFGIITLRSSQIVRSRAAEMNVEIVRQAAGDKLAAVRSILEETGVKPEAVCYIGDDLPDLPVICQVGLGVAVADACKDVRHYAHFVTKTPGGYGAVREMVEIILRAQLRWDDLVHTYIVS